MDVVLNEEDSYIIYLYSFFSSLLLTRLRWMWSSMRKTRILYICIFFSPVYCEPDWDGCGPQWGRLIYYISVFFFLQFIANQTEMDVVLNEEDSYIIYLYFFFQFIANQTEMDVVLNEEDSYIIYLYFFSPVYCEPDWDGCGPQWGRLIYYISVFFLQFIANQTEMDVVLNEEDSYIIYLYFFSSLLLTRLRWTWSSMRKTHILYICIFSPVYCEPDWDGRGPQWGRLIYYISVFFLQFIANQTEMDVVLNEEDSYIIYLYFFSSLLLTRLRWTWSSMRKTHILYICIFSPVYC